MAFLGRLNIRFSIGIQGKASVSYRDDAGILVCVRIAGVHVAYPMPNVLSGWNRECKSKKMTSCKVHEGLLLSSSSLFLIIFFLFTLLFISQATVPASETFRYVNSGYLEDNEEVFTEYDPINYRTLSLFTTPFALCFYNHTPNAFTLALRMGRRSDRSVKRWVWVAEGCNLIIYRGTHRKPSPEIQQKNTNKKSGSTGIREDTQGGQNREEIYHHLAPTPEKTIGRIDHKIADR
ncbi:hypothetical protein OSB04_008513 [Centaurea solstitialis]|uniref:Uncharacterized protein n=1 Tax=Centaurea solstitialis TaxID=347529 RepID=A0AA38TLZ2_9ASTR|nr:hypothetical protein OSB04_008513 [Centaurea solstitialis]